MLDVYEEIKEEDNPFQTNGQKHQQFQHKRVESDLVFKGENLI